MWLEIILEQLVVWYMFAAHDHAELEFEGKNQHVTRVNLFDIF